MTTVGAPAIEDGSVAPEYTEAELRCITEQLGLSVRFLAKRWDVDEGVVRNWMKDAHRIPAWVRADVDAMVNDTEARMDALLDELVAGDALPTYRSDTEYYQELGQDTPYNSSWHRALVARVALEVDVRITYAVPPRNVWKRVDDDG